MCAIRRRKRRANHVQLGLVGGIHACGVAPKSLEQPPVSHMLRQVRHQAVVEGIHVLVEADLIHQALNRVREIERAVLVDVELGHAGVVDVTLLAIAKEVPTEVGERGLFVKTREEQSAIARDVDYLPSKTTME